MPSDHSLTLERPRPVCGNCGVYVQASDITCPACGVLLAAYQAPAGATGNAAITTAPAEPATDTSATHDVAPPPIAAPPAPPVARPAPPRHQPRSQSPIGDALRRSQAARDPAPADLESDRFADELARMATSDSALAREVEAELAGAKVTFDGARPVIETDQVDVTHSEDGAPVVAEHASSTSMPTVSAPVTEPGRATGSDSVPVVQTQPILTSSTANPALRQHTVETTTPVGPSPSQGPATGQFDPATLVRWIPFILIGCVMLGFGRSLPGFGGLIGFALVIGLIYLLVKVAAASSRKTTSMPRDDSWNTKRSRRRK